MEEEESREIYMKLSVTLATGKDTSVAIAPSTVTNPDTFLFFLLHSITFYDVPPPHDSYYLRLLTDDRSIHTS